MNRKEELSERRIKGQPPTIEIISVVISPNKKLIASGSKDKTCKLWQLPTGKLILTILHQDINIFSIYYEEFVN